MKLVQRNGYSLIEVVVSFAIIAVFFVLFQAVAGTSIINRNTKHQEQALRIAQTKINDLQFLGYASLPGSGSFSDPLLASLPQGAASITVADFNEKIKQVTVAVNWQEPGVTATRTVSLVTFVGEGGL
jgi:type II secretory pathway component PulJ